MALKWFGVKVLVRTDVVGRPRARDAHLDADGALVEERIVVVSAVTAERAAEKVKRLVREETRLRYPNVCGQEIRPRLLKAWQSYELFDPPSDGAEVYSETHRVPKTMTERTITARFLSAKISPAAQRKRATFIAAELAEAFTSPAKVLQRTRRRLARR